MEGRENWNPDCLLGFEPEVQVKEGRGCYGRRQGGERSGFERQRRWEGGTAEGFGKGKTGGEAVGNMRGKEGGAKESLDVSKEMGRRRGGEMEVGPRGRRRGSWRAVWMKVLTAGKEGERILGWKTKKIDPSSADQVALQEHRGAKRYLKDAHQAQEPRVEG